MSHLKSTSEHEAKLCPQIQVTEEVLEEVKTEEDQSIKLVKEWLCIKLQKLLDTVGWTLVFKLVFAIKNILTFDLLEHLMCKKSRIVKKYTCIKSVRLQFYRKETCK